MDPNTFRKDILENEVIPLKIKKSKEIDICFAAELTENNENFLIV